MRDLAYRPFLRVVNILHATWRCFPAASLRGLPVFLLYNFPPGIVMGDGAATSGFMLAVIAVRVSPRKLSGTGGHVPPAHTACHYRTLLYALQEEQNSPLMKATVTI